MEHIYVPQVNNDLEHNTETLILEAVEKKRSKGDLAYASGKTLIIFIDICANKWFPNLVARKLPQQVYFEAVWVVGLQRIQDGAYVYGLTLLDLSDDNAPTYLIRINADFESWEVDEVQ